MRRPKNSRRKPEDRTVSFGKYQGMKYTEVPTKYLEWLVNQGWGHWVDRKRWAQEELERRNQVTKKKAQVIYE